MKNTTSVKMFWAMVFVVLAAGAATAQTGGFMHRGGNTVTYSGSGRYLGQYSNNQYAPNSTSNRYGAGSPYGSDSINNPYDRYGSKFSPDSATNPFANNAPKLYDSQGNYRGKLSANTFDSDSVSNPYGRYGSPYSSDSINNPYGAGSRYLMDSPSNPYGRGLSMFGQE